MPVRAAILFAVALTTLPCSLFLCAGASSQTNRLRQEDRTAKLAAEHPGQGETRDAVAGKKLFELNCAVCHGIEGRGGGRGPNLNRVRLEHAPDDAALKSLIEDGIPPEMPEAVGDMSEKEVANVVAYVRSLGTIPAEPVPGDAARGARVYAKGGCASCHIVAGEGTGFGPELTEVGARRSAEYLRECLVKPSANLPEGFLWVEATAAGETVRGIRVNEDTFSIQIKDSSGGYHSLRKQELKELRKLRRETPMPSYEQIFSAAELQDLVAYLASLRGKP